MSDAQPTAAQWVWDDVTEKIEAFQRRHGGRTYLEVRYFLPRVTEPAAPIPPDDGSIPWEGSDD